MENDKLAELRQEIDSIDREIVSLFCRRMGVSAEVADYKRERGMAVLDASRERALLSKVSALAGAENAEETRVLYSTILSLSRAKQHRLLFSRSETVKAIESALANTETMLPEAAEVACQGVEGAYSQIAAEKLFSYPNITYYKQFQDVFAAIESGKCKYGVLPIENSTAGSVKGVYDLMNKYGFYIVRGCRLKIDHFLLAKQGVSLDEIEEIFSHEQAINQSSGFLSKLKGVKITVCENTAAAAKKVSESERRGVAALSSYSCAEIYGLSVLCPQVQDQGNNHTRFICISKEPEIYPGASKTTVMTVNANKPGSLFNLLSLFSAYGINLTKLESRPIPDRDFEFMFYFDIEAPVYSPKLMSLLSALEKSSSAFRYFGSYLEIL